MYIPATLVGDSILIVFNILAALSLIYVILYTPWFRFRLAEFRHLVLGTTVALIVMWNIEAGILPALNFHYVGVMLVTLMFRWQYAVLVLVGVIVSQLFTDKIGVAALGVNIVLYALAPTYLATKIQQLIELKLPHHLFVYLYANGFFGAGLIVMFMVGETALLLVASETYTLARVTHDFLRYSPMMMFGEAFLSGMVLTVLVVFKDKWVLTFDDNKYLRGK